MASPATDVFLSYKAEDRARLTPLVGALEAEGFSVWWDAHIGGGTNWQEDIEQHLESAKCVVVAWSKRSIGHDGHFVRDEARRAQRRDAYVPVCLDGVEPPLGFGEIQALSLKGWRGDPADPRFRAVADAVRSHVTGEHVSHPHVSFHQPQVSRRAIVAGSAGVAAVAAAGGWFLLKPAPANAKRIAVLPFAIMSGAQDQAYFAEGIAEELRGALSRIGLQVIGRASSDAVKDMDTKAAASKLGVANILTGSVRRSPQMLRINAQLVGGKDGVEHWAQSYDRAPGDEIKIQTDIAASVAQALSVALGQAGKTALTLGGTADSAAQDLYLQGVALRGKADSEEAVREVSTVSNAAIARDPNYADAHVLRALAISDLAGRYSKSPAETADTYAQAAAAAKRAIAIAPSLGHAHAVLAIIESSRLDFAGALQHMRQALALSPDDPRVIRAAGNIIPTLGDPQESLRLADRMLALDPLEPRTFTVRSFTFRMLRRYPQALDAARKASELAPQLSVAHSNAGGSLTLMNRPAEAKAEYAKTPTDDPFRLTGEAILAARSRDLAGAERIIAQIREQFGATFSYQYAQIFAQAGDANRAFAELDNAVRARDPGLTDLKVDPFLDPIRRDPRYAALLRRLRFP